MRSSNRQTEIGVAGGRTIPPSLEESAESKKAQESISQPFGGFSKGFLLSTPKNGEAKPAKSSKKEADTSSHSDTNTHTAGGSSAKRDPSTESDSDMPFIKPQNTSTRGPVFPEVQEAMKEAYPLLNTQG